MSILNGLPIYFLYFFVVPKVQFVEPEVEVNENDGNVSVTIIRSGDLSIPSSVRCYTRQGSAQVMMDYDERPNNIGSVVTFLPGRYAVHPLNI